MKMASPAVNATKPSGWIDIRRPAEYPIVLGESLKQGAGTKNGLLNIRYNWQPKNGFGSQPGKLTKSDDGYRLVVEDEDDFGNDAFEYSGHTRTTSADSGDDKTSSLALVFDKQRSVFVLESISTSLDMNLVSGPGQTSEDIRNLSQLRRSSKDSNKSNEVNGGNETSQSDDENPDPTNPFDFRNFLAEAKETIEKAPQPTGGRTPIPGSRTPLSGFASPVTGATRFAAATPQFRPTPTSAPMQGKGKTEEPKKTNKLGSPMKQKPSKIDRKLQKQAHQPLSKERISDSDEEVSDTITIAKPAPRAASKPKGHNRQASSGFGRSPHIIVNDGDLEIDMGSPPHEAPRKRGRVDPGAFSSHVGTPTMGLSPNRRKPTDEDVDMRDRDEQNSEDGDVDQLDLGSPRTSRVPAKTSSAEIHMHHDLLDDDNIAPTPTNQAAMDDEDDEDALAAEIMEAFEEEDNEAERRGLGILNTNQRMEDEESEVSEEE